MALDCVEINQAILAKKISIYRSYCPAIPWFMLFVKGLSEKISALAPNPAALIVAAAIAATWSAESAAMISLSESLELLELTPKC
eukprot:8767471-Ditylum_brightwellii.AAC.1